MLTGAYSEDEFFADLLRVNGGEIERRSSRLLIQQSLDCADWMGRHGVRFQAALRGTLHLSRTNAFFLGGGKALMNAYYAAAARLGIDVFYDAEVVGLEVEARQVRARRPSRPANAGSCAPRRGRRDGRVRVEPRVAARGVGRRGGSASSCGARRTTPAAPLKLLLDAGAEAVGDPRACHAIAVDARAPRFDGGIVTRLDCIPLGIVVNQHGERFADEGEDLWPKRYASWGALIAGAAGAGRLVPRGREDGRPLHAVGVSADCRRLRSGNWRRVWACRPSGSKPPCDAFNAAARAGHDSISRRSTTAAPGT